jgi:hypothetical protein
MTIIICWNVIPYSLVDMDQHFGGISCFHNQGRERWKHIIPKHWSISMKLNGITSQNTIIFTDTTVRISWEIILSKCPWKKTILKLNMEELEAWKIVVTYIVSQTMKMPPINRSWKHAHDIQFVETCDHCVTLNM